MKLIEPIKARVTNIPEPEQKPETSKPVSKLEKAVVYVLSGAIILSVIGLLEAWPK
jgi:hypothetical protein